METWLGQRGGWIKFMAILRVRQATRHAGNIDVGVWRRANWAARDGDAQRRIGGGHHDALAKTFGRTLSCSVCVEDIADESNRVELSTTSTDSTGLPNPVVHYHVPEQAKTLMDWHLQKVTEAFEAAGATSVRKPPVPEISGHFMGTACMGDDPNRSVAIHLE